MDGSKIAKGILGAFAVLGALVASVGTYYLLAYIYTIILGSVFEVGATGDLPITNGSNNTLGTLETSFNAAVVDINTGVTFGTSLVPVVIIIIIFAGFLALGYAGYKRVKGKGGDMGY